MGSLASNGIRASNNRILFTRDLTVREPLTVAKSGVFNGDVKLNGDLTVTTGYIYQLKKTVSYYDYVTFEIPSLGALATLHLTLPRSTYINSVWSVLHGTTDSTVPNDISISYEGLWYHTLTIAHAATAGTVNESTGSLTVVTDYGVPANATLDILNSAFDNNNSKVSLVFELYYTTAPTRRKGPA
ncbi:hypothetical protein LCGC14_0622240 [marine sediment metagenome]|uniref:Uncharacterized protein n=1 Tax=marine sediment metagenome TaxID=412755 RepID=A0A0F9UCZ9_9ZZZZ